MSHSNVNVDLIEGNLIEINGGVTINVGVNVKNVIDVNKNNVLNLTTCSCKNEKYLASIMDN